MSDVGTYDFKIRAGDTFRKNFSFTATSITDLTGFDAELIATDCETGAELLSATTANGKITIDGPNTSITVILSATETGSFTWSKGQYTLKLIDTPGTGDEKTYLVGQICIEK